MAVISTTVKVSVIDILLILTLFIEITRYCFQIHCWKAQSPFYYFKSAYCEISFLILNDVCLKLKSIKHSCFSIKESWNKNWWKYIIIIMTFMHCGRIPMSTGGWYYKSRTSSKEFTLCISVFKVIGTLKATFSV